MNNINEKIRQLEAAIDQALSYDQDTAGLEAELTALQKRASVERRNLSAFQRSEFALKLKSLIVEEAKTQQIRKPESVPQISAKQKIDTRETIAKAAGVSHDTVHKKGNCNST